MSFPPRLRLLEEIRQRVPFDWYAFVLTDPQTTVGSAPLADVPPQLLPRLPQLIKQRYLTAATRWTQIDRVAVHAEPLALAAEYGVKSVVTVVFQDRFGYWGWLDLWRQGPGFSAREVAMLQATTEPVTLALRQAQAETFVASPSRPARPGPVVLLLSRELELLAQTPETDQYLRELVPPSGDRPPIPAGAYNVAAQLLAAEAGVDMHPPWARVSLPGGIWLTLRAATMGESIAVSIEDSSAAERLELFRRASGFSTREGELLGYLAKGNDTKEVARKMFLSEHTVQDHLKSMFAKSSTHNRKMLLARALGA